ncbi:unnamed protein product, partial [Rotaria magnacalcarata]
MMDTIVNTSMTFSDIFDVLDTNDNENDSSMFLAADSSKYYHHDFNFHMGLSDFEEEQEQELIYYENCAMMKVNDERVLSETIPKSHEINRSTHHTTGSFDEPDSMPDYLSVKNQLFDRTIEKLIDKDSSIDIDELRTFAFFKHELLVYRRLYHLWSLYLQAGRGELLKEDPTHDTKHSLRCYWTTHVKLSMSTSDRRLLSTSMTNEEKHIACESFVHQHLEKYKNKIDYYQKQIDEKENNMTHYIDIIKQPIEIIVSKYGGRPIGIKCDFAIAILYNNYKQHRLKIAYEQEKPTDYQRKTIERMCELNYQLEITKKDLILQRLRIFYNKPPTSYDPLHQLDLSVRCNSISNQPLRQQVLDRYKTLIETTNTDLILMRFMSIEAVLDQYRTTLNIETNEMLRHHHNVIDKKMTSVLLDIIDQRANLIKEKMKIISDFHINYYFRHHYGYTEDIRKGKIKDIQR